MQLCLVTNRPSFGPSLAHHTAPPLGGRMFIWILIAGMAIVGGVWVKTRRQRKAKAAPYVGN